MLRRSRPQRTLSRASSSSAMPTAFLFSARRQQRGFVQQIRQFRAGITRRAARDDGQIHVRRQLHVLGVDLQNRLAPAHVRQIHRHLPVETAGTQQRRVQHVRPVGRGDDDDAFLRVKAVHLDEQRVERLLALVVAAAQAVAAADGPTASISSMKIRHGVFLRACSNMSRTRLAPTPTNISTKSEPLMLKNAASASPAMALASSVLPVPGGPTISTPLGMRPPSRWNFFGSFKNSTSSETSSMASSMPATSLNVVLFRSLASIRALLLPKLNAPLPAILICRMKKNQNNTPMPAKTAADSQ